MNPRKSSQLTRSALVSMVEDLREALGLVLSSPEEYATHAHEVLERADIDVSPEDRAEPSRSGPPYPPRRHRLPDTRRSVTREFTIQAPDDHGKPYSYRGTYTVGLYDNGSPGEVFLEFDKIGGSYAALLDAWATMVSIGLQCGMPVRLVVEKFRGCGFEPSGWTTDPDIPSCRSVLDYVAKRLSLDYLEREQGDG